MPKLKLKEQDGMLGFKVDAYTAVWNDACVKEVLKYYHIDDVTDGFWEEVEPKYHQLVYGDWAVFEFEGIVISVPAYERFLCNEKEEIFLLHNFKKIRVAMMGKSLDFMRGCGIDVDSSLSVLRVPENKMHVTRVDFAFDFLNYQFTDETDLIDKLNTFLTVSVKRDTGRVLIQGHKAGIGYTKRFGSSERTIYLGSSGCDKILRIYDKKMERTVKNYGKFDECEYMESCQVQNWIRVEWQLRNNWAEKILFSDNYECYAILKEIDEYYQLYRADDNTRVDFFHVFFNVDNIRARLSLYIQKTNFVSNGGEQCKNYIERNMRSILAFLMLHGVSGLQKMIQDYLDYLQTPVDDEEADTIRKASYYAFLKKLTTVSNTGYIRDLPFYEEDSNGKIKNPFAINK